MAGTGSGCYEEEDEGRMDGKTSKRCEKHIFGRRLGAETILLYWYVTRRKAPKSMGSITAQNGTKSDEGFQMLSESGSKKREHQRRNGSGKEAFVTHLLSDGQWLSVSVAAEGPQRRTEAVIRMHQEVRECTRTVVQNTKFKSDTTKTSRKYRSTPRGCIF